MNTHSISENGKSPKEIQAFRILWEDVVIFIKWEPNCYSGIISHLEIMSENSMPFPISETGYRSHFCEKSDVESCG